MSAQSNELLGSNSLHLIEVELDGLRLPDRELRNHSSAQIEKIARSIEQFGWVSPILVTPDREVIAGAARIKAARKLGHHTAPALRVDHLTPEQVRFYRVADNRLAEDAEWDREALRLEISDLLELDIDIELTGFETGEIDVLLDLDDENGEGEGDTEDISSPISEVGDIWRIGEHRLICGDALAPETWAKLGDIKADAAFVDAPYNVKIDKHVCGLGKVKHREFVQASGEMSTQEFAQFLGTAHQRLHEALKPGGVLFSCMDWRSIASLVEAGEHAGFELINMVVWDKTTGGMGSLYRSQHELICVFRNAGASHRNNVQLGKHGRNRTNVWTYAGMNTGGKQRDELLSVHPTVKPVELVIDAIKDVTAHGETVVDCFGGSGTTMVAAQKAGRKSVLLELDPVYVDTIIERMTAAFGLAATLEGSGETYAELKAERDLNAGGDA